MKKDLEKKLLVMEAKQERGIRKIQIMMLAFMVNTIRQKDKDNKVYEEFLRCESFLSA